MSSLAKASISISKKDLNKSRILPVGARNVVFYHKATAGQATINLNALIMPSEMPTNAQATIDEINGSKLLTNKKNLSLVSSSKGLLIQGLSYIVTSSFTIQLIGAGYTSGAEIDEIFTGTINASPVSDLVVASAKSIVKTYTLAVGQNVLNLGNEYQVGVNPNENVGVIKVFANGVLAIRDSDYAEVDSGNGYGTTVNFFAAPASLPYQVVVDFGVMSITDNNAIGSIQSLSASVLAIANDLAIVAGSQASDYYSASPSDIERRTFGDSVLSLLSQIVNKLEEQSIIINLAGKGNFTSGSIKVTRVGSQVIVSALNILNHANLASVTTGVVLPSWAIPAVSKNVVYYADNGWSSWLGRVTGAGALSIDYYLNFVATARTNASDNFTIAYNV